MPVDRVAFGGCLFLLSLLVYSYYYNAPCVAPRVEEQKLAYTEQLHMRLWNEYRTHIERHLSEYSSYSMTIEIGDYWILRQYLIEWSLQNDVHVRVIRSFFLGEETTFGYLGGKILTIYISGL